MLIIFQFNRYFYAWEGENGLIADSYFTALGNTVFIHRGCDQLNELIDCLLKVEPQLLEKGL